MITVERAEQIIKNHWFSTKSEEIALEYCAGKILAEPVYADRDYPPINRVMMDGIAINKKAYDLGLRAFPISGMATAGTAPLQLENIETCIEVMTGCVLPSGANLVIPYEQVHIHQGMANITVETDRNVQDFVHQEGSDCHLGELVIPPGTKLKGIHLGILASFGYSKLLVEKPIKIKVIATGDELIPIDQKPQSYQLRRSNVYALKASLLSYGYLDVEIDHIPDIPELIIAHYQGNHQPYDLLIYSGGISQGKRDYLPEIWQKMGVVEYIHGVKQKPGKPMWFGVDNQSNTVILGLPGNPVSGLVCLHRYFLNRTSFYGRLQQPITFQADLTYFVPVKINAKREFTPIIPENSGDFVALAGSDGFVELPQDQKVFTTAEDFLFYPWY
ncbi:molybdopterin biosynthesis protein MoeA [Gloeomargarita lithophora Alchichica-D10]|uniref:Molybdopterin molybdenumtransferase n=1 Tax=Gloeomargarita lithophora Alchichica-D10 TaxID=1188229 RepID=A0A1J0ADR4_9CYAN|nr:molybdopterin molybdotransferase MoeA [Gloeomargarita lithophora]APB34082.1 molybdopterin biosynthesis protein MoeA [Gloeomargarita lithophora Alchichica-D10]